MADQLRVGIIGCGALGRIHAERFAAIPDVVVAGLAEPHAPALRATAAALPEPPRATDDYRELLDFGLDAVCIASPDGYHVAQVLDALAAGLHVLCEKPLTPDPLELQAVIEARDAADRHVAMTYPRRYDAGIRAMRREILSGAWGEVVFVSAYNAEDWVTPNVGTWRHDPEICPGGFFYDANGHQIDTVLWAAGLRATTVRCHTDNRNSRVPLLAWGDAKLTPLPPEGGGDEARTIGESPPGPSEHSFPTASRLAHKPTHESSPFRGQGGIPMAFDFVGTASMWREQVAVHCERMDFVLQNGVASWVQEKKLIPMPPDGPDESGDEAFIKLIRGEGPNYAPPDELWPVLTFTAAALRSAETGRQESVEWPAAE